MPTSPVLKSTKVVSIIVPMCNEEESIDLLREKLGRLQHLIGQNFAIEYCMVDDGSTDGTWNLMRSAVPQSATYVMRRHDRNRGVGAAIRTGLEVASGSIVCTIDADCSYPPEDLCALIDLVACGDADVAVASPYHPAGGVVGVKRWRILLSRQCSLLYRFVSPLKIHTYTSIFRAYTGNAARRLRFGSDGFVSAVEILMCAHRMGYRVREVPLVLHARQRGYSKIRIAKTICAHLGLIMREAQVGIMDALGANNRRPSHSANQSKHASPLALSGQFGEEETPVG